MNTCKTCKWWGSKPSNDLTRLCNCPKLIVEVDDKPMTDRLRADAYDDRATILTGPDFGCVHWKKK